jgi:SAM-dependent methyltransferase
MDDDTYTIDALPRMLKLAQQQRSKDALFIDALIPYFRPGPIIEIGAGVGQLSELLAAKGRMVVASDIEPFFVEYMASIGLHARILDATDLGPSLDQPVDNILAQSISVLITRDLETVRRTYGSIRAVLARQGRFVFILPTPPRSERWSRAKDHLRIADESGFDLVHTFRHQAVPSSVYDRLPPSVMRQIDGLPGRLLGVRRVFVFSAREPA